MIEATKFKPEAQKLIEKLESQRPIHRTFDEEGNLVSPSESEAPLRRYVRTVIDNAITHDLGADQIFQDGFETNVTGYVGESSIVLSSDITNTQGPELVATPDLLFDFDPDYSRLNVDHSGIKIQGETALEHELAHYQSNNERSYIIVNFHRDRDNKGFIYPEGVACLDADILQFSLGDFSRTQQVKILLAPKYPSEYDFKDSFYIARSFVEKLKPYLEDIWEDIKSGKVQLNSLQRILIEAFQVARRFPIWDDRPAQKLLREQLQNKDIDSEGYLIDDKIIRTFLFGDWRRYRENIINFNNYTPEMLVIPEAWYINQYDLDGNLKKRGVSFTKTANLFKKN